MYTTTILLSLLPLLSHALPSPSPSSPPATSPSNTPSAPAFMTGTNQTFSAWSRADCGQNTSGDENIWIPNLLYGKNNHALVVSYMLGRDMAPDEQLDMSFFQDAQGSAASDGSDKECALFQYTASPDVGSGMTLKANTCYTPAVPVTCVNIWKMQA